MSKEKNILQLTVESIKNDDLESLDYCLRIMPLEKVADNGEDLLGKLLRLSTSLNRKEATDYILDRWKVLYPDSDKLTIFTRLFLLHSVPVEAISVIILQHPEITYLEVMDELCDYDASPENAVACGKVDEVFGNQSHEIYKIVQNRAKEAENYLVEEYIFDNVSKTAPLAEVPSYVKNYEGGPLPSHEELVFQADKIANKTLSKKINWDIPDDEAVELLTTGLTSYGISLGEIETAKKAIRKEIADRQLKRMLLEPILKEQQEDKLNQNDELLFRIFGPSNPIVGQNLNDDGPSSKYGGGRMFLFNLFDYDEENDFMEDWFTGNCIFCQKRIANRYHAVRRPSGMGGWKYCYCSWKCVEDDLQKDKQHDPDVEINTDESGEFILVEQLIEIYKGEMEEIGIQDRI